MSVKPTGKLRRAEETLAFLEQLTWLLESRGRKLDLNFLRHLIMEYQDRVAYEGSLSPSLKRLAKSYVTKDPDKQYLVGALPGLLQDLRIFPANKDIADFAKDFLLVPVTRFEKRSRYEMIGLVVCHVNDLDNSSIERLASRLSKLLGNDDLLNDIANEKMKNELFTWNDVIRRLGT